MGGLTALAVTLSGVEAASGAPPPFALKYVIGVANLPNDEVPHEVSPLCPRRTKVLGGGVFTLGGDPREDVEATSTFPDDLVPEAGSQPDDGWIGAAVNSSNTDATVGTDLICGRSVNPKYRSASIPLPTGAVAGRQALCPPRTRVTGGGVETSGAHKDIEVVSTFPLDGPDRGATPDDGWFGRASNDSGVEQEVTVFAICTKLPRLVYRKAVGSLPGGSTKSLSVKCRQGARVTGGGVDLTVGGLPSLDLEVSSSFTIDGGDRDRIGDDGWETVANNDGLTGTMKVYAICKRPPR
jgi:hypothetical protein